MEAEYISSGSWMQDPETGKFVKLGQIVGMVPSPGGKLFVEDRFHRLQRIPISHEILLACGFAGRYHLYTRGEAQVWKHHIFEYAFNVKNEDGSLHTCPVAYLDELQSLYKMAFGTELEISF